MHYVFPLIYPSMYFRIVLQPTHLLMWNKQLSQTGRLFSIQSYFAVKKFKFLIGYHPTPYNGFGALKVQPLNIVLVCFNTWFQWRQVLIQQASKILSTKI